MTSPPERRVVPTAHGEAPTAVLLASFCRTPTSIRSPSPLNGFGLTSNRRVGTHTHGGVVGTAGDRLHMPITSSWHRIRTETGHQLGEWIWVC